MRLNANRDIRRPADPDAYWRRRFFILGGGLVVLMLVAWLLSGGPSPSATKTAASKASMAAEESRAELPSAAYGSAWPGLPRRPAASPKPSPKVAPSATPTARRTSSAENGGKPGRTVTAGATCKASDIVLSLLTSQASYGPDARPQFDVYAVSTAPGTCQMTYGPASVRVIVTRHGQVVWDSATCPSPAAGTVRFARGVPRIVTIAWNRKATGSAGCAGSLSQRSWGTFEAVVMAHGQASPARSFTLQR
jgi:hypothetical protein